MHAWSLLSEYHVRSCPYTRGLSILFDCNPFVSLIQSSLDSNSLTWIYTYTPYEIHTTCVVHLKLTWNCLPFRAQVTLCLKLLLNNGASDDVSMLEAKEQGADKQINTLPACVPPCWRQSSHQVGVVEEWQQRCHNQSSWQCWWTAHGGGGSATTMLGATWDLDGTGNRQSNFASPVLLGWVHLGLLGFARLPFENINWFH